MTKIDEDLLLDAFLNEVLPKIERLVTRALRDGRSLGELAIDLERTVDGAIKGGCAPREAVAQRWLAHPRIPAMKKMEIAAGVRDTPDTKLPVVLSIAGKAGLLVYGLRRLAGDVIGPDKPN